MLLSIPKCAIIVAGGLGTRMQIDIPKQFLILKGKPLLNYSLEAFYQYDSSIKLVVVLSQSFHQTWKDMCTKFNISIPHCLCDSGSTRFLSSKNGLNMLHEFPDETLIAVHDAARPFIDINLISRGFELAAIKKTAVAVVDLKDSIREFRNGISIAKDRNYFKIVQTPQIFQYKILKSAFENNKDFNVSDDATVVEMNKNEIFHFLGDYQNIKITTKEDLINFQ